MEPKKRTIAVGLGAPTLILLLLAVCLAVFAALSLTTAQTGLRQAQKAAQAAGEYYLADWQAEELLAQVDEILGQVDAVSPVGFLQTAYPLFAEAGIDLREEDGRYLAAYSVPLAQGGTLEVELLLTPWWEDSQYKIRRWQTVPAEWTEEEGPALWQPAG